MRHFDNVDEYHEFVQEVADAERDMVEDVPEKVRRDFADGYEGGDDEYTIAKRVIGVPTEIDGRVTMRYSGDPYVTTRACPVAVFICSDKTEVITDEIIDTADLYQAAIRMFAQDLKEELT